MHKYKADRYQDETHFRKNVTFHFSTICFRTQLAKQRSICAAPPLNQAALLRSGSSYMSGSMSYPTAVRLPHSKPNVPPLLHPFQKWPFLSKPLGAINLSWCWAGRRWGGGRMGLCRSSNELTGFWTIEKCLSISLKSKGRPPPLHPPTPEPCRGTPAQESGCWGEGGVNERRAWGGTVARLCLGRTVR